MGYGVAVLDPSPGCPASHLADHHIQADFSDAAAVRKLASLSAVMTFEFENVDPSVMDGLESFPSLDPLFISRNRWREKNLARNLGISTAPFFAVNSLSDLRSACANPEIQKCKGAILKTCEGGYDGKGQWRLQKEDLDAAKTTISLDQFAESLNQELRTIFTGPRADFSSTTTGSDGAAFEPSIAMASEQTPEFILEGMVDFSLEFSIVGTGFSDGSFHCYAPVRNEHRNGILHRSLSSANLEKESRDLAVQYASSLSQHFRYVGTFAVEFFLENGKPVFNEMAPRPHNSGHLTMDAKISSQFEQHIRAICNLPAGSSEALCEAVMINLIGEDNSDLSGLEKALEIPGLRFHWYGKTESRKGRKMGHITAIHQDLFEAEKRAHQAFECLGWARQ